MAATLSDSPAFACPWAPWLWLAVGFVGARFTGAGRTWWRPADDNAFATVRSVQAIHPGAWQIAFDETHRRVVSGGPILPISRNFCSRVPPEQCGCARGIGGPAAGGTDTAEVRDALMAALGSRPQRGRSSQGLDKLKPLAADPEVRKTLARVLQTDDNAAVRMQVVDLLVARRDDTWWAQCRARVQREDNSGVRQKLEKALKDLNASVGTF